MSVRVTHKPAHKSYTPRRALTQNNTERTCTRANCPISNTNLCLFQSAKTKSTKASKSRPSRLKRTLQIYDFSKRSTFENTNLPSTPEKNAANSRTFYSNNYFNTSRDSSYFGTHSLYHSIHFYSYLYLVII